MVVIKDLLWQGYPGYQISNPAAKLFIPRDFGPRVLAFNWVGGDNLLAELPEAAIAVEGEQDYSLRGGHRLWAAPESPQVTYAGDDTPPQISPVEDGVDILQTVDRAGLQKSWRVRLDPEKAELRLDHQLTNQGKDEMRVAPWAVTMLRPGGVGVLPLPGEPADEHGVQPNRQLVLWPYTDVTSPHLALTNRGIVVRAELKSGALKIGAPNPAGWIAYSHKNTLFIKRSSYQANGSYPDQGASHQIYCDPGTIELETLGPLVNLRPGKSVGHQEVWELYPAGQWPQEIEDLGGPDLFYREEI